MPKMMLAALAAATMLCGTAKAVTFTYNLTSGLSALSSTGTLTATPVTGGNYLVTAMSGTNIVAFYGVGGFHGNDDLLFPSSDPVLDNSGISFREQTATGIYDINLFSVGGNYFEFVSPGSGPSFTTPARFTVTSPATAPEPAAWAMMIAGFGLVGYAMRRRKVAVCHA